MVLGDQILTLDIAKYKLYNDQFLYVMELRKMVLVINRVHIFIYIFN